MVGNLRMAQLEAVADNGGRNGCAAGARIALVHYTAPPVIGGVEAVVAAQARLLRHAGYDVVVVAGRGDATLVPELDSAHPDVRTTTACLAAGYDPPALKCLADRIRERLLPVLADRDLIIAHNLLTMPFNLAATAALVDAGLPVLAWTHDVAVSDRRHAGFRRGDWPWSLISRRHPRAIYVAISETRGCELAQALDLAPDEVEVVPNAVDPVEFAGLSSRVRKFLTAIDALNADPLVLVPQRITPNKRLELVLEAAAVLARLWPALRVLVTGPLDPHSTDSSQYADELLRQRSRLGLDQVVSFAFEAGNGGQHPLDTRAVTELYRVADVAAVTSATEGFSLPIVEAALARVPVVCTDLTVTREVGAGGIFSFPADGEAAEVAGTIQQALASAGAQQRRGVITRYGWWKLLPRLEALIARALHSAPRSRRHANGANGHSREWS